MSEQKQEFDKNQNEEISLIDLLSVLLKRKVMIIIVTLCFIALAVLISIISLKLPPEKSFLPNMYTSSAYMLINDSNSSSGTLSSMLNSSGLGSLAGLAGINTGSSSSYSSLAGYLVKSNSFLDSVVKDFDILSDKRFTKSKFPKSDSREFVKKMLSADMDKDTSVFKISCKNIDPAFAMKIVNYTVDWLSNKFDELGVDKNKIQKENLEKNLDSSYQEIIKLEDEVKKLANSTSYGGYGVPSVALASSKIQLELSAQREVYRQLKTQYELLKVQMQSETPVFQILERPEVPDKKSAPSRGKLCIIMTFAGFFISIFMAFLLNAIDSVKNDKEAMKKLRG
ncbi:Wzz/FepE/Etk N-terminal domain-containing protein [Treponema pectinovorum]|uniref:Wzz/FepE/Etk N-terminal domain-containing protein n=1 Tax=Treponema pectinovorum TaxID=164 RepID=UPI0011CA92FF|nr:Wzz/FepE/Etk N-terminal domain-containing protein [Treponema pectinovorum]